MGELVTATPQLIVLQGADEEAVAIGELYRQAKRSAIETIARLLEAGHRLKIKRGTFNYGEWTEWVKANEHILGFDMKRAQKLKALATRWGRNAVFDETVAAELVRKFWGNMPRGTFGSGENEWYTPEEYITLARKVLGVIDLDPASNEQAQEWIQAEEFYTEDDDGLSREWHGRVWLNPPYAQPDIALFADKMAAEWLAKRVAAAIVLTHNYTDTQWFQTLAGLASAICFPRGRIKFIDAEGKPAAPTQGQAFTYFGQDARLFVDVFSELGFVVVPT